jgi:hypothetical protein
VLGLVFYGSASRMSGASSGVLAWAIIVAIAGAVVVIVVAIGRALLFQRELSRRGVRGGVGSDAVIALPPLFDLDFAGTGWSGA